MVDVQRRAKRFEKKIEAASPTSLRGYVSFVTSMIHRL